MPSSPLWTTDIGTGPTLVLDNGGGDIKACLVPRAHIPSLPAPLKCGKGGKQPIVSSRVDFPCIDALLSSALSVPNALAKPGAKAISAPASVVGRSRRPGGHLVGREILNAPDMTAMTLRRPHDRGFVSLFDTQRDVWASVFSEDRGLGVNAELRRETSLILTEAIGVPLRVRRATDQLVYETFGFGSCAVSPAARLSAGIMLGNDEGDDGCDVRRWNNTRKNISTMTVVDTGFSASVATPIISGREVPFACRRLALGGKALTNLLKQTVSYRSWNMSDETMVMTAVKERACYCTSFIHASSARKYAKYMEQEVEPVSYLLPDPAAPHMTGTLGRVCPKDFQPDPLHDQVLPLRNERVAIPEALFHPGDIGVSQAGLHELVMQAVDACHAIMNDENDDEDVRPDLFANVLLTGGNCQFGGFYNRFIEQLRPLVPGDFDVKVHMESDPALTPLKGALRMLKAPQPPPLDFVSRAIYLELGTDAILRQLHGDD